MFLTDKEILAYLKTENEKNYAFNQLIKKYQERVYWQARRMVVEHDDANDITQNVFIKILTKIQDFRGDANLYTWIYRIAVNETIDFLNKKRKRFYIPIINVEAELERKIDDPNEFSGDVIQKKLQKAILKLPVKQRIVFNFRYFEEKSYDEISKIVGTSVGGLKANYHHAVKKIEKFILKED
ncbi:MAG: sigma-70 family RNA polymerase sigma factor [Bacteroidota bacterium]|nr:sigma-70 family RNA polymerase sigma factor [Bacteroidota bacterium]